MPLPPADPAFLSNRNWRTDPLWRPESVGWPIPDDPHAVSVSLPTWASVIGYEEKDPEVVSKMRLGYPRFVVHPAVKALFEEATRKLGNEGEQATVWPLPSSAERAAAFVRRRNGRCRVVSLEQNGLTALLTDTDHHSDALYYWRISGDIASSRLAENYLSAQNSAAAENGDLLRGEIRSLLAHWAGQKPENVYLFPSGMAAIFFAQQAVQRFRPGSPCAQVEFPYVDALRVQKEFSGGSLFTDSSRLNELNVANASGGVFTEVPSNPLLRTPDFSRLKAICQTHGLPLIVDDTVASVANVDLRPYADVVTTSLTKWVSGTGNLLGGALIIQEQSTLATELHEALRALNPPTLSDADAAVLLPAMRDFPERVARVNQTARQFVSHLQNSPSIRDLWHPLTSSRAEYDLVRRENGGYGGLLSFTLRGGEEQASRFYDAWRIAKGPSLGTGFSLACPFTILAHYDELPWAAESGVPRDLIRLSIGLEEPGDLIARFESALAESA